MKQGEYFKDKKSTKVKKDGSKRIIKGVVYEPMVEDTQGDFMTAEEIEKSAYAFMENLNIHQVDKQHDFIADEGYVCESYIALKNDPDGFAEGSWIVAIKVKDEDTWEEVEKADIDGISLAGIAYETVLHDTLPE